MIPPRKYQALALEPGALYRQPGKQGSLRFEKWRPRYCSLHGEKMGWEAEFRLIKASGRESYLLAFDPTETPIELIST